MKDELVTFETAKLAKEKGFDIEVYFTWLIHHTGETLWDDFEECQFGKIEEKDNHNSYLYRYSAPTQSLLQRWLREECGIDVNIFTMGIFMDKTVQPHSNFKLVKGFKKYHYSINADTGKSPFGFDSHEGALEEGLITALKLIKND